VAERFGSDRRHLIMKVLETAPSETELAATKAAGQLVGSGVVGGKHVMVLIRPPGIVLAKLLPSLPDPTALEKSTGMSNIKTAIAQEVVAIAKKTRFWHK
jgi:hypothetical protein